MLSTSLKGLTPTIWTNFGNSESRDGDFLIKNVENLSIKQALLASTAVPILTNAPLVQYDNEESYEIDGAIMAKSPSTILLANLLNLEKIQPKDLVILSLSCGHKTKQKDFSSLHDAWTWGYANRIKALIASSFDSHEELDDSNSKMILEGLGGTFLSFHPALKDEIFYKHYDFSKEHISNLEDYSQELIENYKENLDQILGTLVESFS
jgi:hypothetical protein